MFVLVIMSRGMRGGILLDCYNQPVDLVKIRDLLSPSKFPFMKGKPKMLIVQACSGGKSLNQCGSRLISVKNDGRLFSSIK